MESKHLNKVDFSFIRYANVWEDAHMLIYGLDPKPSAKILSIASAGDNSLSLLVNNPSLVLAVDVNKVQLYLTELKKMAVKHLELKDYERLFGYLPCADRIRIYKSISEHLSEETQSYWEKHMDKVESGLLDEGKFEKYLHTFAKRILPFIHGTNKVVKLFEGKSLEDQKSFYDKKWNTWLWRSMIRLFFSKKVMGLIGRDPAFLKHVEDNVGRSILEKVRHHLGSVEAQNNPILKYCLTGSFGSLRPHFLEPNNYKRIKENIDALEIMEGYTSDAADKYGKFTHFNLSNIFEYMDVHQFKETVASLEAMASPGARFAYWNLLVDRKMSEVSTGLSELKLNPLVLSSDQGFFYKSFNLTQS